MPNIPIDPKLPRNFDDTPNDCRPASHERWWYRPFIRTESLEKLDAFYAGRSDDYAEAGRKYWTEEGRKRWLDAWPSGTRYEVRCLDGGAWDRSTSWGMFQTLAEAEARAAAGSPWGDIREMKTTCLCGAQGKLDRFGRFDHECREPEEKAAKGDPQSLVE